MILLLFVLNSEREASMTCIIPLSLTINNCIQIKNIFPKCCTGKFGILHYNFGIKTLINCTYIFIFVRKKSI